MPSKKPSPAPFTAAKAANRPPPHQNTLPLAGNARQQPDNRWQRTKRYGWDSR